MDYIKVTNSSVLTNITMQVENKDLQFQLKDGVQKAVRQYLRAHHHHVAPRGERFRGYGRRSTSPTEMLQAIVTKPSIYQKSIPLAPGMYRLERGGEGHRRAAT